MKPVGGGADGAEEHRPACAHNSLSGSITVKRGQTKRLLEGFRRCGVPPFRPADRTLLGVAPRRRPAGRHRPRRLTDPPETPFRTPKRTAPIDDAVVPNVAKKQNIWRFGLQGWATDHCRQRGLRRCRRRCSLDGVDTLPHRLECPPFHAAVSKQLDSPPRHMGPGPPVAVASPAPPHRRFPGPPRRRHLARCRVAAPRRRVAHLRARTAPPATPLVAPRHRAPPPHGSRASLVDPPRAPFGRGVARTLAVRH